MEEPIENGLNNKYLLALEEATTRLKECQTSKDTNSCFKCLVGLDCSLRIDYVNKVYESLSKGKKGEFNFE